MQEKELKKLSNSFLLQHEIHGCETGELMIFGYFADQILRYPKLAQQLIKGGKFIIFFNSYKKFVLAKDTNDWMVAKIASLQLFLGLLNVVIQITKS